MAARELSITGMITPVRRSVAGITPEFYFAKAIDNSRLVLAVDPRSRREIRILFSSACALFLVLMFYTWQHFGALEYGYKIEALKSQRASLIEMNRALRLEEASLAGALAAYGGPLLPGDGPADWVVSRRQALEVAAVDAAARLASLRLQNGEPQAAAESARQGLSLDRYRDDLWKLLIEAADRSGHHAEAGQARRAYAAILDELGV